MWNTRSTFPLPPAPARNKALNKRKALAGSSGGGLAFFIPALFLFRSAPASKTFTNLRPHPARFRPSRTSALSLPARSGARSPLAAVAAASPSFSPYPTRSCLGSPLPSRPCTSAPALHSRPGPPLPPRPSAPAPALHSRLGPPLPPRPAAPALALRSRLGPPLPPRPPTPASATHSRPSYPPPLYLYIPPQMFHVEHLGSLFVPGKLRTFFCVCWHEIQFTGEECSTWNILPL